MSAAPDDLSDLLGPVSDPVSGPLTGLSVSQQPAMTESALADLLGLTARRIRQLVSEGVLVKPLHHRDSVRAYCAWLREKASRGVAVQDDLKAEKIRQAREAADKLALQNAAARGELVRASDVESAWSNVLRDVRSMMLAVPSRCGASLAHLTPHDVAAIDREIKSALEGLVDGDA